MGNTITVTVGNNVQRQNIHNVNLYKTIRDFLSENGIDYSNGGIMLDGTVLKAGDFDHTFGDFRISPGTRCYLLKVVKADNA